MLYLWSELWDHIWTVYLKVVVCWRPSAYIVEYGKGEWSWLFFKIFIAKKVCTACSRTNNDIVPLIILNKYLYNGKSEMKLNINNNSENSKKTLRLLDR